MSRSAGRFPGAWHMGSQHRVLHGEVRSCLQTPQGLPPRWAAAAPVARASNATSNTARSRAMVASDQCDDELRRTLQIGSGEAPHKRCCIASLRLQQPCGQGAARRRGNRLRALGQGDARDTLPRSSAALQIAAAAAVRLLQARGQVVASGDGPMLDMHCNPPAHRACGPCHAHIRTTNAILLAREPVKTCGSAWI